MSRSINKIAGQVNSWTLPLLAFSLPVSTSAVTVLTIIIVLLWIIEGDFKRKWAEITSNEVCLALLLYLGLYIVGFLWSSDTAGGIGIFKKQWKLLLLPVLVTVVRKEDSRFYGFAFLAGMTVAVVTVFVVPVLYCWVKELRSTSG